MKRQALALFALTAAVSFLLGLVAAGPGANSATNLARRSSSSLPESTMAASQSASGASPAFAAGPIDFAGVAARLNSAVVNVDSTARDADEGVRSVLPRRWSDEPREGSGSGFIIDATGLILTNYHVIYDATRVTVTLKDGRMLKASVVGVDPAIDVALLQVTSREALPVAPLGRSSALRVGEWVCAIGNPLGYVHSVTVGVVSFLGRKVFDPSLDALIQTDAAITFGNSGGPLINAMGQVVGITTAVSAQAANIGFAVPIDQVAAVLPQLRETGRVTRGDLGVRLIGVTPALQRALRLEAARGALVQDVSENAPADRAGVRTYDVIVAADDREIASDEDLNRFIASRPPGAIVKLEIARDGRTVQLPVKLAERPLPPSMRALTAEAGKVRSASRNEQWLGLSVTELDPDIARRANLPETMAGIVITSVDPAGPSRVPIKAGQILLEINRQRITSVAQYHALVATLRSSAAVALLLYDPVLRQRLIQSIVPDPPS